MPFDIKSFSSFVCFVLPQKVIIPPKYGLENFPIGVDTRNLQLVIAYLNEEYAHVYERLAYIFKGSQKNTFELFMKAVVARCVKISEKATTYGHFLLVCSLIYAIVADYLWVSDCFACPNLCHFSLISVYDRCYKEFFDSREGTDDTLDSYLTALKDLIMLENCSDGALKLSLFGEHDVKTVMKNLIFIEDVKFPLTEYELEMLEENTCLLAIRQPPVLPVAHALYETLKEPDSTSSESEYISSASMSSEEFYRGACESMGLPKPYDAADAKHMFETWPPADKVLKRRPASQEACEPMDQPSTSSGIYVNRVPEFKLEDSDVSDDTNMSSASSSPIIDPDRTPDWDYFKLLICKFCRLRCSCHAMLYLMTYIPDFSY